MKATSALFQPANLGTLRLGSRLIMAAMGATSGVDAQGRATERLLEYYRARARGGTELIITQFASVSADALMAYSMNLYDDSHIPEWRKIVDAIHGAGSKVCIQLMHFGMLYLLPGSVPPGLTMRVPSMMPWLRKDMPCQEVSEEDIDRYVDDFGQAARRAKEAGADAVELHGSNGCLISAFLSPVTNRRTDRFGGNAAKRALFPRRTVEAMRKAVGPDFPMWVRINATDDLPNGTTVDESIEQALILQAAGSDARHRRSGVLDHCDHTNLSPAQRRVSASG
ncbi:MAG: NADH:flavin oxidoreductase [Chloroflexi bacterium]|nr:NADH:flavin oxidoreductase [Chloroflexota bacterium]